MPTRIYCAIDPPEDEGYEDEDDLDEEDEDEDEDDDDELQVSG
jgi:hypothetical protein